MSTKGREAARIAAIIGGGAVVAQHPRHQPEMPPVRGDVAEVAQGEQVAPRGRAGDACGGGDLARREARMLFVERFDDPQAFAESFDQVLAVDRHGYRVQGPTPRPELMNRGKPAIRMMIAQGARLARTSSILCLRRVARHA